MAEDKENSSGYVKPKIELTLQNYDAWTKQFEGWLLQRPQLNKELRHRIPTDIPSPINIFEKSERDYNNLLQLTKVLACELITIKTIKDDSGLLDELVDFLIISSSKDSEKAVIYRDVDFSSFQFGSEIIDTSSESASSELSAKKVDSSKAKKRVLSYIRDRIFVLEKEIQTMEVDKQAFKDGPTKGQQENYRSELADYKAKITRVERDRLTMNRMIFDGISKTVKDSLNSKFGKAAMQTLFESDQSTLEIWQNIESLFYNDTDGLGHVLRQWLQLKMGESYTEYVTKFEQLLEKLSILSYTPDAVLVREVFRMNLNKRRLDKAWPYLISRDMQNQPVEKLKEYLDTYCRDVLQHEEKRQQSAHAAEQKIKNKNVKCFNCGSKSHVVSDCPKPIDDDRVQANKSKYLKDRSTRRAASGSGRASASSSVVSSRDLDELESVVSEDDQRSSKTTMQLCTFCESLGRACKHPEKECRYRQASLDFYKQRFQQQQQGRTVIMEPNNRSLFIQCAHVSFPNEDFYVLDNAATTHQVQYHLADDVQDYDDGDGPLVNGQFGAHRITQHGQLKMLGGCQIIPGDGYNLISLNQLLKYGFTYSAAGDVLTLCTPEDKIFLTVTMDDSNLYRLSHAELNSAIRRWVKPKSLSTTAALQTRIKIADKRMGFFPSTMIQSVRDSLTKEKIRRAKEAERLKQVLMYPSDQQLKPTLDGHVTGTSLCGNDVDAARKLFGDNAAEKAGKLRRKPAQTSQSPPAIRNGEVLHMDLVKCKDNIYYVMAVDEHSGMGWVLRVGQHKSTKHVTHAVRQVILRCNARRYRVDYVVTDDEKVLNAVNVELGSLGIEGFQTEAGLKEKRVERWRQTVVNRMDAVRAGLPYELPDCLEGTLFQAAAFMVNLVCNSTSSVPPYESFYKRKFDLNKIGLPYGTIVDVPFLDKTSKGGYRTQLGIALGLSHAVSGGQKAYIWDTKQTVTRRDLKGTANMPPISWKFKPHALGLSPEQIINGVPDSDAYKLIRQDIRSALPVDDNRFSPLSLDDDDSDDDSSSPNDDDTPLPRSRSDRAPTSSVDDDQEGIHVADSSTQEGIPAATSLKKKQQKSKVGKVPKSTHKPSVEAVRSIIPTVSANPYQRSYNLRMRKMQDALLASMKFRKLNNLLQMNWITILISKLVFPYWKSSASSSTTVLISLKRIYCPIKR